MTRSRIPFLVVFIALAFAWRPAFAQPTITSLNPSAVTAGGPAFTLTVTGANFTTTSLVRANASVRATNFVSALQLTATILASDIASPGPVQITVIDRATGATSKPVILTVNPAPTPGPSPTPPSLTRVLPGFVAQAATQVQLTLVGSNFSPGAAVVISPPLASLANSNGKTPATDVAVLRVTRISSTLMTALIAVGPKAATNLRAVDVVNPDGTSTAGFPINGIPGTSQPLRIQSSNSLGAPLSILTLAVTHPRDGTVVMQGQELNAEAILGGAGTGTVIGQWVWDGNVVEQFSASIVGGQSSSVQTRQSLPTYYLGVHTLQLRMVQPNQIATRTISIVINPGDWRLEALIAPAYGAMFPSGHPPLLRWAPVPAAAKYQVGFSDRPLFATITKWYEVVDNHWQVPDQVWNKEPEGELFWTVRTVETSGLTRKPVPMRSIFHSPDGSLTATQSAPGRTAAGNTLLEWKPLSKGVFYRVTVSQDRDGKQVVRKYLTSAAQLDLRTIDRGMEPGKTYFWQVDALSSSGRLLISGPQQSFVAGPGPKAALRGKDGEVLQLASLDLPITRSADYAITRFSAPPCLRGGCFLAAAYFDLTSQITKRTPEPDSSVTQSQPVISVEFQSKVNPLDVSLMIDDLDVTAMSQIEDTKITYTPAMPLSNGSHGVNLILGSEGASWKITIAATAEGEKVEAPASTSETQPGTDAEKPPGSGAANPATPAAGSAPGTETPTPEQAKMSLTRQEQFSSNTQWASGGNPPALNAVTFAENLAFQEGPWHANINGSGLVNSVLNPDAQRTSVGRVNDYVAQLNYKIPNWEANLRFGMVAPVLYTGAQFVAVATPRQAVETILTTRAGAFGFFTNTNDLAAGGGAGITFHQKIMGASWVAPLLAKWAEFRFMWLRAQDIGSPTVVTFDALGHPILTANPVAAAEKGDVFGGLLLIHLTPLWLWTSEYAWSHDNPNTLDPTSTTLFGRAWRTGVVGQQNKTLMNVAYRDLSPNFADPANPALTAASRADLRGVDATVTQTTPAGTFGAGYSFLMNNVHPVTTAELLLHNFNQSWAKPFGLKTNLAVTARESLMQTGTIPTALLGLTPVEQGAQDMRDVSGNVNLSHQFAKLTLSAGGTRDWNHNTIVPTASTITSALTTGVTWIAKSFFQLNSQVSFNWVAAEKFTIGETRNISTSLQPNFTMRSGTLQVGPLITITQGRTLLATGTLTSDTLTGQYGGRVAWTLPGALKFNTFSMQGSYNQNRNTITALDQRATQLLVLWTVTWGQQKHAF